MSFIDPAVTLNESQGSMASLNVEEDNSTNSQSTRDETTQDIAQDSRLQETQNAQQIYRKSIRIQQIETDEEEENKLNNSIKRFQSTAL